MAFRLFARQQPRRAEWVTHLVRLAPTRHVRYALLDRESQLALDRLMVADIVRAARSPRIHGLTRSQP